MYHYVYRITNIISNKHYYGKRSCNNLPSLDLGVKYFSSSHDEDFIKDQKQNPQNYKYKIIRVFDTSKDALSFEIKLHVKFDVDINESFYNKCKQTSVGFCFSRTGIMHSDATKQKMSEAKTGKNHPMYGKTRSDATKQKISEALTGKLTGKNHHFYGKTLSDATKQKLSEAKTGENHYFYGKTHSDATKQKLSEAKTGENHPMYGTMWVTNGASNLKIKKTDNIPDGYYKGRVCKKLNS